MSSGITLGWLGKVAYTHHTRSFCRTAKGTPKGDTTTAESISPLGHSASHGPPCCPLCWCVLSAELVRPSAQHAAVSVSHSANRDSRAAQHRQQPRELCPLNRLSDSDAAPTRRPHVVVSMTLALLCAGCGCSAHEALDTVLKSAFVHSQHTRASQLVVRAALRPIPMHPSLDPWPCFVSVPIAECDTLLPLGCAAVCIRVLFCLAAKSGGRSSHGGVSGVSSHRISDAYHYLLDTLAVRPTQHATAPPVARHSSVLLLTNRWVPLPRCLCLLWAVCVLSSACEGPPVWRQRARRVQRWRFVFVGLSEFELRRVRKRPWGRRRRILW